MWRDKLHSLTHGAALLGVALLFTYLEAILLPSPLPGVKLGLSNIVVVYAAYRYSMGMAALISLSRIFVTFFLFGGGAAVLFSLSGGLAVLLLLCILRKIPPFCSYIGVSVLCAAMHTIGQLCFAIWFLGNVEILFSYGGLLLLGAAVCGFVTGLLLNIMDPVLEKARRHARG